MARKFNFLDRRTNGNGEIESPNIVFLSGDRNFLGNATDRRFFAVGRNGKPIRRPASTAKLENKAKEWLEQIDAE